MSLQHIIRRVSETVSPAEITKTLKSDRILHVQHAAGSLPSFLPLLLHKSFPQTLIITADDEQARALQSDLAELGHSDALYFPIAPGKPYDRAHITDSVALVERSEILDKILSASHPVVVASILSLFQHVAAPDVFTRESVTLRKNDTVEPDVLREQLATQGYTVVPFVDAPGELAWRGGILDVFPFTGTYPVRLEFFGDEIDSIREFDPATQRSVSFLDEVRLVPDVSAIENQQGQPLIAWLDDDALIQMNNPALINAALDDLALKTWAAFHELNSSDLPAPSTRYMMPDVFEKRLSDFHRLMVGGGGSRPTDVRLPARPQPDFNSSIKLLRTNLQDLSRKGYETVILCDNDGQRDRFEELLGDPGESLRYELQIKSLHEGFILDDEQLAVYTDHQIFNRYHRPKLRQRKHRGGFSLKEIKDLKRGDYVVHVDYGIGQFEGFTNITVRGNQQEAVVVRYAGDSTLYVNVSSLHKLQKYTGKDGAVPKITKLGSGEWARKKAKTRSQIKDIARDLIELYARRKAQKAHAFPPDSSMQTELEASFEFEETPDQFQAIQDVKGDMMSDKPMDRLVCGDVGFGKTEVAVRAAFKAVADGKQVAVLVPTTILADQHAKTFKRRMQNLPVNIEMISRFRTTAEIREVLKKTAAGQVDILVGTHRITSKDVKFKDLGLLIIDEEQRFGVSAKEKLKELRTSVDVLTLTATPIPRTLQFSLMGARDLSVINTPPPNRQPVYTEIHTFDSNLIRDAIIQEISRNGQVFFINNRINNIEEVAEMIRKIVPNVRVRFAHGQMKGPELEKIILDFYAHKFDVLVSTNIVENGIDIPNANTIIINRADHFGLSELHQLRGRVGRSNRKAFCYLMAPPMSDLNMETRKRLMALVEFSDLGSGFNIAMRDLDIRGAGDLLGASQSGFINEIGFELYTKILNDAVKELKETEFADLFAGIQHEVETPETVVEFDLPAQLEKRYVSEDIERLNLYRRLAKASSIDEIADWESEVADRFGKLPASAQNLITAAKIRLAASRIFLTKVLIRAGKMWLETPSPETEAGQYFYENGIFQSLLKRIEKQHGKDHVRVTQKNHVVRIVLDHIPDIQSAQELLVKLSDEAAEAVKATDTQEETA